MIPRELTVRITVDTSRFDAAMRRVWLTQYRRWMRWRRQPSDPNPFPRLRLFRWLP